MPRIWQIDCYLCQNSRRPLAQHKNTPSQIQRLIDIVRHQECREFISLPQYVELGLHVDARQAVQIGEWFIQQHDRWLVHQGPCKRSTLCHATGQLMRIGVVEAVQTNSPQHIVHAFGLQAQQTTRFQAERHVLPHRAPRIQRRVLKDQDARWIRRGNLMCACEDVTCVWTFQAGDQAKQGGLATAARPEQCHEFSRPDGEVDGIQHRQQLPMEREVV